MGWFRDDMHTWQALGKHRDLLEKSSKQIRKPPARAFDFKGAQGPGQWVDDIPSGSWIKASLRREVVAEKTKY